MNVPQIANKMDKNRVSNNKVKHVTLAQEESLEDKPWKNGEKKRQVSLQDWKTDLRRKSHALGLKAASIAATVGTYKTKLSRYASTDSVCNSKVTQIAQNVTLARVRFFVFCKFNIRQFETLGQGKCPYSNIHL